MIAQSHGNSTNITQQTLDAAAAARADEQADAKAGRELLERLEAKWRNEGRQWFLDGESILACWNHFQREAYLKAAAEYIAVVEEADLKPELDYAPVSVLYAYTEVAHG